MILDPAKIVTRALRLMRVIGDGEQPSSGDMAVGWDVMQDMLDAWRGDPGMVPDMCGDFLMPGFESMATSVEVPDDESRGLRALITYNLAAELAPEFGVTLDAAVAARAAATMHNWRVWVSALHMGRMTHTEFCGRGHYNIRTG